MRPRWQGPRASYERSSRTSRPVCSQAHRGRRSGDERAARARRERGRRRNDGPGQRLRRRRIAVPGPLAHPPATGQGAYIYNALSVAVEQLATANIAAGAVILLSDGASQGAKPIPGHNLTAASLGASATAAHAKIYTVGLRDSSYTPQRMSLLARVGGGAFIESSSSQ